MNPHRRCQVASSSSLGRLIFLLSPLLLLVLLSRVDVVALLSRLSSYFPVVLSCSVLRLSCAVFPCAPISSCACLSSCCPNPPSNGSYPTVVGDAQPQGRLICYCPAKFRCARLSLKSGPSGLLVQFGAVVSPHSCSTNYVTDIVIQLKSQLMSLHALSDLCCAQERLFPCLFLTVHLAD